MDQDNETVEVADISTGEIIDIKHPHKLVAEVRDTLLRHRRAQVQSTVWEKMEEKSQQAEIDAMDDLANELVSKVVEIVAEAGCTSHVTALLESYTVKDGATKIVAKGRATNEAVLELNKVGEKMLKIVVIHGEQFDQERPEVEAMPDQPDLLADDSGLHNTEQADQDLEVDEGEKFSRAYIKGREAHGLDQPLDMNPYPEDHQAWSDWQVAWMQAQHEADNPPPDKKEEVQAPAEEAPKVEPEAERDISDPKTVAIEDANTENPPGNPYEEGTASHALYEKEYHREFARLNPEKTEGPAPEATEDVTEDKNSESYSIGFSMAGNGHELSENPNEEGTPEFDDWIAGFNAYGEDTKAIQAAGAKARADGLGPHRNPYDEGTDNYTLWLEGYDPED